MKKWLLVIITALAITALGQGSEDAGTPPLKSAEPVPAVKEFAVPQAELSQMIELDRQAAEHDVKADFEHSQAELARARFETVKATVMAKLKISPDEYDWKVEKGMPKFVWKVKP